jgi:hypothetical protein
MRRLVRFAARPIACDPPLSVFVQRFEALEPPGAPR